MPSRRWRGAESPFGRPQGWTPQAQRPDSHAVWVRRANVAAPPSPITVTPVPPTLVFAIGRHRTYIAYQRRAEIAGPQPSRLGLIPTTARSRQRWLWWRRTEIAGPLPNQQDAIPTAKRARTRLLWVARQRTSSVPGPQAAPGFQAAPLPTSRTRRQWVGARARQSSGFPWPQATAIVPLVFRAVQGKRPLKTNSRISPIIIVTPPVILPSIVPGVSKAVQKPRIAKALLPRVVIAPPAPYVPVFIRPNPLAYPLAASAIALPGQQGTSGQMIYGVVIYGINAYGQVQVGSLAVPLVATARSNPVV